MLGDWAIVVLGGTLPYVLFSFPTYAAAEAAVRQFLEGLPDRPTDRVIPGYDKPEIPTDKTTGVDEMKFKAE